MQCSLTWWESWRRNSYCKGTVEKENQGEIILERERERERGGGESKEGQKCIHICDTILTI